MKNSFNKIYQESIQNPEEFWKNVSDDVFWFKKPTKILNKSNPPFYKWFEDGITNTCYNALDHHIDQGRGEKLAIIYDSPITGVQKKISYKDLRDKVALFAGALKNQGVIKGDRVIIYMPMIPEAVIAMLACGRIGAVHSVVFGGFAANELASRIDDSKAKLIVSANPKTVVVLINGGMVAIDELKEEKNVAIITAAGSTGISLHSDLACKNQKKRVMFITELSWAADSMVQQLGRVHRSNQKFAPEFRIIVSRLGGESRYIGAIKVKLRALGAMTKGERNSSIGNSAGAEDFSSGESFFDNYCTCGEKLRPN